MTEQQLDVAEEDEFLEHVLQEMELQEVKENL